MTHLNKLEEYGNEFIVKVIHSLLKNRTFLLNIRDVIELDFFTHPGHHWVVDQILKYFDKNHTTLYLYVNKTYKNELSKNLQSNY